jgi:multidrug efflux pump
VNQAKGNFDGKLQDYTIGANDQLLTSADYRPLVVAYRNGAPVVLSDMCHRGGWRGECPASGVDERIPGVIVNIQRQPGANIIAVVDRVKKLLPQLARVAAASVEWPILTDRTTTIRASVDDVQFELMLTIAWW